MIRKMVRYTVRRDELSTVLAAIETFVAAIGTHEPDTDYVAYREQDGASFTHFMAFGDAAHEEAHRTAAYTDAFVAVLYPRCLEPPVFTDVEVVRSAR